MLKQEKTHHIDTFPSLANSGDDESLIYADESKVFQSITLAPNDVLNIRRKNKGLSVEELSLLSGIPTHDIACMENGSLIIDAQTAQKLALALNIECSDFTL